MGGFYSEVSGGPEEKIREVYFEESVFLMRSHGVLAAEGHTKLPARRYIGHRSLSRID